MCEVVPEKCLTENSYVDTYIFINLCKNYNKNLAPHLLFSYTPALPYQYYSNRTKGVEVFSKIHILISKITKEHNSKRPDPTAPIFFLNYNSYLTFVPNFKLVHVGAAVPEKVLTENNCPSRCILNVQNNNKAFL